MSETGVVVGIHDDQAIVEMEASRDCEACGACRYTSTGRMVAPVRNTLNAVVGDTVKVDIEPEMVVAAAMIVYILPIALFFVGYSLFMWFGDILALSGEMPGVVGALLFLIGSFFAVRIVDRRVQVTRRYEPKMYDIIRRNPAGR